MAHPFQPACYEKDDLRRAALGIGRQKEGCATASRARQEHLGDTLLLIIVVLKLKVEP